MKPYIEGRGNLFDHAVTSRNADAGIAFAVMPRFYLNVTGSRHSKDDEGVVFASPAKHWRMRRKSRASWERTARAA